jgi:glycosyltransferase involved in cell wall biosynthesis
MRVTTVDPITVTLYDDAPIYGGAERYLELLATGFDPKEVAARVVLAREKALDPLAARLGKHGIPVTRLPRIPTLSAVGPFLRAVAHFTRNRSQIFHFNMVDPRACNAAIAAAKLASRTPIMATNQLPQSPFDDLPTPRRHRIAMAEIKRHIVVSEANRADLAAHNVDHRRIAVIHNATEDPGPVTEARRAAARKALGVEPDATVVGFAGRFVAQKNPKVFVEMAAEVARVYGNARFVMLGDGPERASLEMAAHSLGVADRLSFLGHREDAIELYAGFDLLVFTSQYEGLPFAVIEAMFLGLPVVAFRIPGMSEAVVDRETGRLVGASSGGAKALGSAIIGLLSTPDVMPKMGAAARARAIDLFSLPDMIRKTVDVYREIVRSQSR